MQIRAVSHPFDRFYFLAFRVQALQQTGKDRASVYEHGAGATLAEFAAVLGSHQTQIFAQDFEQRLVRGERHLRRFAVEEESNMRFIFSHHSNKD